MTSKIGTLLDITSGAVTYNNSMIHLTQISYITWEKKYSNLEFFFHVVRIVTLILGCLIALSYLYTWINYSVILFSMEDIKELNLFPGILFPFSIVIFWVYVLSDNPNILEITSSSGRSIKISDAGSEEDIKNFYKEINACIPVMLD